VIKLDGSVWAWGGNIYGQLGDGTTKENGLVRVKVLEGVTAVSAGGFTSLAIKVPESASLTQTPMVLPGTGKRIAYIYSNSYYFNKFKLLLETSGYTVDTINHIDVGKTDFSKYDLIIMSNDTQNSSTSFVNIQTSHKPILGMYYGGLVLFRKMGLSLALNAVDSSGTRLSVRNPNHPIFYTPNPITVSLNRDIDLGLNGSRTGFLLVNTKNLPQEIQPLLDNPDNSQYSVILKEGENIFWGFDLDPDKAPENVRKLFINMVDYLIKSHEVK
jgi:hypothetical protein